MDLQELKIQTQIILTDVLEKSALSSGDIFVLGLSSSEVIGSTLDRSSAASMCIRDRHIGKNSSQEVGEVIVKTMLDTLSVRGIYLAVQGCEHVNRALVVEKELAQKQNLEIVNVLPTLHAGGSGQLAAFKYMSNPVEVEFITAQAGLDIGDTAIGMHIKHVQIPVRPILRELGEAHVTALASRPKLIGGVRAAYQKDKIRKA